jgi:hypothetical protein
MTLSFQQQEKSQSSIYDDGITLANSQSDEPGAVLESVMTLHNLQ